MLIAIFDNRLRYLENSGCVGMCVNMCKFPTQDFFTREFGLPLTMIPSMSPHTLCLRRNLTLILQYQSIYSNAYKLHVNNHLFVYKQTLNSAYCLSSDFEDMSCEMVYGQVPPSFEDDPVSTQPCFTDICEFLKIL